MNESNMNQNHQPVYMQGVSQQPVYQQPVQDYGQPMQQPVYQQPIQGYQGQPVYPQQPVEPPMSEEEKKTIVNGGRKFFNKLGLSFIFGTLIIYGVQMAVAILFSVLWPELLENQDIQLAVTMIPMYAIGMPLLMLLVSRIPAEKLPARKMTVGKWLIAAMMAYAIMYISNIIGTIITFVVELIKMDAVDNVLEEAVLDTGVGVRILFVVICAPIFEELIFRKLLVDRAVRYGEGVAVVLSGLMFGLFHGNLAQFIYATTLGMFFAFIYVKTGKIIYTIALHMFVNFVGGVLGVWILELSGYTELMANPALMEEKIMEMLLGMLILLAYVFVLIGIVIAGFVLLIVFRKKFKTAPGKITLPKGKRFVTVICNVGMILFCLFFVVEIILQLIGAQSLVAYCMDGIGFLIEKFM